MTYLFLDCLVYNYTSYTSLFFLTSLNKRSLIYIITLAFMLDFIVLKTWYINFILLLSFYFLRNYIFKCNYRKFINYMGINLLFVTTYYVVTCAIYSYLSLRVFINLMFTNAIFYAICYIKDKNDIKLCRVK